jgi:hypothetical protein
MMKMLENKNEKAKILKPNLYSNTKIAESKTCVFIKKNQQQQQQQQRE